VNTVPFGRSFEGLKKSYRPAVTVSNEKSSRFWCRTRAVPWLFVAPIFGSGKVKASLLWDHLNAT
jgi:hypothetical protein